MSKKMLEICAVCGCKALWKAGIVKGKQRYRCKNCNKNQAETDGRVKYSGEERKYALVLYLNKKLSATANLYKC